MNEKVHKFLYKRKIQTNITRLGYLTLPEEYVHLDCAHKPPELLQILRNVGENIDLKKQPQIIHVILLIDLMIKFSIVSIY